MDRGLRTPGSAMVSGHLTQRNVTRTVAPTKPPQVDYDLTDTDREVLGPVRVLAEWALGQTERIEQARHRCDERATNRAPSTLSASAWQ